MALVEQVTKEYAEALKAAVQQTVIGKAGVDDIFRGGGIIPRSGTQTKIINYGDELAKAKIPIMRSGGEAVLPMAKASTKCPPAPSDLMQPIASAPKIDGRVVMLFCPDQKPQHVAAIYQIARLSTGEVAWQGWMYQDQLLAELLPEGPQGATHWYHAPETDAVIARRPGEGQMSYAQMAELAQVSILKDPGPRLKVDKVSIKTEYEQRFEDPFGYKEKDRFADHPGRQYMGFCPEVTDADYQKAADSGDFTFSQLMKMRELKIHPKTRTLMRRYAVAELDDFSVRGPDDAIPETAVDVKDIKCPVLRDNIKSALIINPASRLETVSI